MLNKIDYEIADSFCESIIISSDLNFSNQQAWLEEHKNLYTRFNIQPGKSPATLTVLPLRLTPAISTEKVTWAVKACELTKRDKGKSVKKINLALSLYTEINRLFK